MRLIIANVALKNQFCYGITLTILAANDKACIVMSLNNLFN